MKNNAASFLALCLIASTATGQETTFTRFIDEDGDRVPTHTVVPVYPREARRDRLEGDVQVCYFVDRKGFPYRVAVRTSTHRVFEKPAIRAIRASTYAPLKEDETSSGIKTCRTFRFRLEPEEPEKPQEPVAIDSVSDPR